MEKIGHDGLWAQQVSLDVPDKVKDWEATVSCWFIHAPHQSPAWDSYMLGVIHLRDIDGVKPARKHFQDATHEVLMAALDPSLNPTPTNVKSWRHLLPLNLCIQLSLPNDDAAADILRKAAIAVVDGELWAEPPLSGQKFPWNRFLAEHAYAARLTP